MNTIWNFRTHCQACGHVGENHIDGDQWWTERKRCPNCGGRVVNVLCRWVSTATWYLPWTWLEGYWEFNREDLK